MKTFLSAVTGIIVFITIPLNLEAADFTNDKAQQMPSQHKSITVPPTQVSLEEVLAKSQQRDAEVAYDQSILAANRNDLILAHSLIEEALQLNHSNLKYLAFATDIAFISKEYDRAEEYQTMMLLVAKSTLGLDNLRVAEVLDQLAVINIAQDRNEQARFRLQESLQLRERVLGDNHLLIISSLNKLALLAIQQQLPLVAEPLLKRSLDIARKVSGSQHNNSAILLTSLADFYQQEGRLKEAEVHYKEAISIWDNSPSYTFDRMMGQNSLGKLHLLQQKFDDARIQFEQVLSMLKNHYKSDHPYIQQAIKNIELLDAEHNRIIQKNLMYDELVRVLSFQLLKHNTDKINTTSP